MSVRIKLAHELLSDHFKLSKDPLPVVSWTEIKQKGLSKEVMEVYRNLGGLMETPEVLFPPYDLEYEGFALQVDGEINFNRYRAATLQSLLYKDLPDFPLEKYKSYCRNFEAECTKSASFGHLWSNTIAEKEFGKPGERGELYKEGAPSWRYKAFQDFMIDLVPLIFPLRMIRLSIYDNLLINSKMYRLGEIIISSRTDFKSALTKYLLRRINEAVTK